MDPEIKSNRCIIRNRSQISRTKNHLKSAFDRLEIIINDEKKKYFDKIQSLLLAWEQLAVFVSDSTAESSQIEFESLFLHTLKFVLRADWPRVSVVTQTHLSVTLQRFMSVLTASKSYYSILHQCRVLESVVKNPWSHPVLSKIFADEEVDFFDLLEYFQFENGQVILVRLEMMLEAQCEDMAMRLSKSCLQTYNNSEPLELDFNQTELDYVLDIYFCTLYKQKMKKELTTEIKLYELDEGLQLLKRYNKSGGVGKGFNNNCREIRVWKCSDKVIELVANTLLANAVLHDDLILSDTILPELISEWATIYKTEDDENFSSVALEIIGKLVIVASTSTCIYPFCSFLIENYSCTEVRMNYVTRWLIRAVNQNMNEIERCRVSREYDKLKCAFERLSEGFIMISKLFSDYKHIYRECLLTSFSLTPSREGLQKLEAFVDNSLFVVNEIPVESGELIPQRVENETPLEVNHVPKQSVNVDQNEKQATQDQNYNVTPGETIQVQNDNVIVREAAPAYYAEVENLEIDESVKLDLNTILRYQRFRTLSWELEWSELKTNCEKYLEAFEARGFDYEVKLQYLDLDYNQFKDKPINEDDYIGIEKGYEQFMEMDEEAALESEYFDDDDTNDDEDYKRPRKRKKDKKGRKKWKCTSDELSDWENLMEFANGPGNTKMIVKRRKCKTAFDSDNDNVTKSKKSPSLCVTLPDNQLPDEIKSSNFETKTRDMLQMITQFKYDMEADDAVANGKDVLKICIPNRANEFSDTDNERVNEAVTSPIHAKRLTMRIRLKKTDEFDEEGSKYVPAGYKVRSKRCKTLKPVDNGLNDELRSILDTFETADYSSPALSSQGAYDDGATPSIEPIILRRKVTTHERRKKLRSVSRRKGKKKSKYSKRRPAFEIAKRSVIAEESNISFSPIDPPTLTAPDSLSVQLSSSVTFDELNHADTDSWNSMSSEYEWDPKYTSLSFTPMTYPSSQTDDV